MVRGATDFRVLTQARPVIGSTYDSGWVNYDGTNPLGLNHYGTVRIVSNAIIPARAAYDFTFDLDLIDASGNVATPSTLPVTEPEVAAEPQEEAAITSALFARIKI